MATSSTKCRRPFSVVVCSAPTLFQEVPSGRARLYKGLFEYMRWDDGESMHVYNNTIAKKQNTITHNIGFLQYVNELKRSHNS